MRRAALLALLALPIAGVAQTTYTAQTPPTYNVPTPTVPGTIGFLLLPLSPVDGFINLDECLNHRAITLRWLLLFETVNGVAFSAANLPGGSFQLYANDQASNTTANQGPCAQSFGDKGVANLNAGSVGPTITSGLQDPSLGYDFDLTMIASVAGQGACNESGADIMVCVQAKDRSGTNIGEARVKLTVATTLPKPPLAVSATPGDGALNVAWAQDATSSPTQDSYVIDAVPVGTIIDPTPDHSSPRITTTTFRLGGLVNGQTYSVTVRSFSTASNESGPSAAVEATPTPVLDFFNTYKADGGRETGGCASGSAGVLALAALGGFLAMARRRR
jgi:hypothetical protein